MLPFLEFELQFVNERLILDTFLLGIIVGFVYFLLQFLNSFVERALVELVLGAVAHTFLCYPLNLFLLTLSQFLQFTQV
jgi:hypothetical protein